MINDCQVNDMPSKGVPNLVQKIESESIMFIMYLYMLYDFLDHTF